MNSEENKEFIQSDADHRQRFVEEVDKNFSVIAPAGVGKTTAIVDRIVLIAQTDENRVEPWLPRLAVVTYTVKAAEEMLLRTRHILSKKRVNPEIMGRLNQAYFGTIHSFCLDIVRKFGLPLGLSTNMQIIENDYNLWIKFLREMPSVGELIPEVVRTPLFRHISIQKVIKLARKISPDGNIGESDHPGSLPKVRADSLLHFEPTRRNMKAVLEGQKICRTWLQRLGKSEQCPFLPLPKYSKGGKAFKKSWNQTFSPLQHWLSDAAHFLAKKIAKEYQNYRLEQNIATYDDIISHARALLKNAETARAIRATGYRVILDEAQDTDAGQFEVLIELARSLNAPGTWAENNEYPPEKGRFCMVGDPQQSIYEERADLAYYRTIHERLIRSGSSESALFCVTMRCDRAIVNFVNAAFPAILKQDDGTLNSQVNFVPLEARPDATKGQVLRVRPELGELANLNTRDARLFAYADYFANWLKSVSLSELQARDWSQVAILCPRKALLEILAGSLKRGGLKVQIQSRAEKNHDNPVYLWFTALVTVMAQPDNAFELVGILREWYGVSDHELALFSAARNPTSFQIKQSTEGSGNIAGILNGLFEIRQDVITLPLRDAMFKLVNKTDLRAYFDSIPDLPSQELNEQMDQLLIKATEAERERISLIEFAKQMREGMDKPAISGNPTPGNIQLITCHKAKGLGWDAVVIPFLSKPIGFPNEFYPRIHKTGSGMKKQEKILLESGQEPHEWKTERHQRRREGLERLLYVATTRARHSLVLFDDRDLFGPKMNAPSFTTCLQVETSNINESTFNSLPGKCREEILMHSEKDKETIDKVKTELNVTPNAVNKNLFNITKIRENIIKSTLIRKTPSTLKNESPLIEEDSDERSAMMDPEFDEEIRLNRSTEYGNWWHYLMESLPWRNTISNWGEVFEKHLDLCPDQERGRIEWAKFLDSTLISRIREDSWIIKTEVPFIWKEDQKTAFEGVIDLLGRNKISGEMVLVDWKTDRIEDSEDDSGLEILKNRYSPQLTIYGKAIKSAMTGPLSILLYSTRTGQHLEIDTPNG